MPHRPPHPPERATPIPRSPTNAHPQAHPYTRTCTRACLHTHAHSPNPYLLPAQTSTCKAVLEKRILASTQNIHLNRQAWEACFDDQNKFCRQVKPGNGAVFACLRDTLQEGESGAEGLQPECRDALFDQAQIKSESVHRNREIDEACKPVMTAGGKCDGVPPGEGRVLECLVSHFQDAMTPRSCKDALHEYLLMATQDYRLDYQLQTACAEDVERTCRTKADDCDGTNCHGAVMECLIGNVTQLSGACQSKVRPFLPFPPFSFLFAE